MGVTLAKSSFILFSSTLLFLTAGRMEMDLISIKTECIITGYTVIQDDVNFHWETFVFLSVRIILPPVPHLCILDWDISETRNGFNSTI